MIFYQNLRIVALLICLAISGVLSSSTDVTTDVTTTTTSTTATTTTESAVPGVNTETEETMPTDVTTTTASTTSTTTASTTSTTTESASTDINTGTEETMPTDVTTTTASTTSTTTESVTTDVNTGTEETMRNDLTTTALEIVTTGDNNVTSSITTMASTQPSNDTSETSSARENTTMSTVQTTTAMMPTTPSGPPPPYKPPTPTSPVYYNITFELFLSSNDTDSGRLLENVGIAINHSFFGCPGYTEYYVSEINNEESVMQQVAATYSEVAGSVSYSVTINVLESMYIVQKYIIDETIKLLIESNISETTIDKDKTNSSMTQNITDFVRDNVTSNAVCAELKNANACTACYMHCKLDNLLQPLCYAECPFPKMCQLTGDGVTTSCGCADNYVLIDNDCIQKSLIIGLSVGIGGFVILILIVAVIVLLCTRSSKSSKSSSKANNDTQVLMSEVYPPTAQYSSVRYGGLTNEASVNDVELQELNTTSTFTAPVPVNDKKAPTPAYIVLTATPHDSLRSEVSAATARTNVSSHPVSERYVADPTTSLAEPVPEPVATGSSRRSSVVTTAEPVKSVATASSERLTPVPASHAVVEAPPDQPTPTPVRTAPVVTTAVVYSTPKPVKKPQANSPPPTMPRPKPGYMTESADYQRYRDEIPPDYDNEMKQQKQLYDYNNQSYSNDLDTFVPQLANVDTTKNYEIKRPKISTASTQPTQPYQTTQNDYRNYF